MSVATPVKRESPIQSKTRKPIKKFRKSELSGHSLLARGEPFVWLTGGALMVCLTMTAALAGLIGYQGLSTFWPREVWMAARRDAGAVLGEKEGQESHRIQADGLKVLGPNARTVADRKLMHHTELTVQRQLLRSGNFEHTGRHYTYIDEVNADFENLVQPQNVWLFERMKNGRLLGFPTAVEVSFVPELQPIVSPWVRLSNALKAKESDDSQAVAMELEQVVAEKKRRVVHSWLEELKRGNSPDQILADNFQPWTLDVDPLPYKLIARWTGISAIESRYHADLKNAQTRRKQLRTAQERLSLLDAALSQVKMEVKQFEIDHHLNLQSELELLLDSLAGLDEVRQQQEMDQSTSRQIMESGDLSATGSERLGAIILEEQIAADLQIASNRSKLDELLSQLNGQSETAFAFFVRLVDRVEPILHERLKVTRDLSSIESESSAIAWQLALPVDAMANTEISLEPAEWNAWRSDHRLPERIRSMAGLKGEGSVELQKHDEAESSPLFSIKVGQEREYLWVAEIPERTIRLNRFQQAELPAMEIVRGYPPNRLSWLGKLGVYVQRWCEFIGGEPREANSEGGVFPAIWGTVVMTIIMALVVIPFGVMAALYLREYTHGGLGVSLIRICINNLAGVPSIVYGVFGLAFFCYTVGGYVDGGPGKIGVQPWPPATWFVAMAVTASTGFAAFLINVSCSGDPSAISKWRIRLGSVAGYFWLASLAGIVILLVKTPFFDGFYEAHLPSPTFGKGALVWASLTLSLLTLPVVIVATEEALSAVPNSLREGSYACGASKWQTIHRIVLPHARPGILTGSILAMARGAGEVAPLILVGAIASTVDLPLDAQFPYLHGSRSFMHLGFHIFHQGFMSQNSEASKAMVFTSTLLLIAIIALLNLVAIQMRSRLRRRFQGSQF